MISKGLPQHEWVKTSAKAISLAHNPKVGGSNPPPATREFERLQVRACNLFCLKSIDRSSWRFLFQKAVINNCGSAISGKSNLDFVGRTVLVRYDDAVAVVFVLNEVNVAKAGKYFPEHGSC